MTGNDRVDLDRAQALMMAALDGEATEQEQTELETLLTAHPGLREDWDRLRRMKEVTGTMTLNQPPQEVWDTYWTSVYRRVERGIAWVFISIGTLALLVWFGWQAVQAVLPPSDQPGPVRVAVLALMVGGAILLISVVRERWYAWRRDRYSREVVR